jgi:hypothetical protein
VSTLPRQVADVTDVVSIQSGWVKRRVPPCIDQIRILIKLKDTTVCHMPAVYEFAYFEDGEEQCIARMATDLEHY